MRLRLGTRGSALAVAQSGQVADELRARGHTVELVRIKTGGDVERGSLTRLGTLGVFAAELRTALLEGRCDLAVHSLKDLPTAAVPGLVVAAVPARADARDALCARDGLTLAGLPAGATVGTGSPRRVAQLRAVRPDLLFVDVRGNVGTRLARVAEGDLDAVVLAAAGLDRLGLGAHVTDLLEILPAPGQGALALECRSDDAALIAELAALEDPATREAVDAERAVLAALGGGCAAPIAAWGRDGELAAGVFAVDGSAAARTRVRLGPGAGETAAAELVRHGAADVADLDASRPSRLAELHDDTSLWRGGAILAGLRILLPQADGALADGLRAAGAEVVAQPVQRRVILPPQRWPGETEWMVFTSATTLEAMAELGLRVPPGARVAAVGPRTAEAARAAGLTVELVPSGESSAAALVRAWPEGAGRVVIPGSALSSPVLADGLRAKGYAVEALPLYTMEPLGHLPGGIVAEWEAGLFDVVAVTAGSAGEAVGQLLGWREDTAVVAFGPPSAESLRRAGASVAAVADTQDAEGLIAAIATLGKDHQ
jgi:hydroxymethylbilane synthase